MERYLNNKPTICCTPSIMSIPLWLTKYTLFNQNSKNLSNPSERSWTIPQYSQLPRPNYYGIKLIANRILVSSWQLRETN